MFCNYHETDKLKIAESVTKTVMVEVETIIERIYRISLNGNSFKAYQTNLIIIRTDFINTSV